jgi:hypothetical protein
MFLTVLVPALAFANENKIESFIDEAKGRNEDIKKHVNAENTKQLLTDYGKPAKEASYKESQLREKAQTLMNTSHIRAEDKSLPETERVEAQAAVSLKESVHKRKRFDNLTQEEWMKKSDLITENPLIGVGAECRASGSKDDKVEVKAEPYEVEVDDVRSVESEEICEEDGTEIHKCNNTLKLTCKNSAECDSGGIVLKSLASDMKWVYSYPTLTLGTIADNYWRASCGKFTRNTQFEVKNKTLIDEFRIVEVGYDDYMRIIINGTQVYNGPFGGEKLETDSFWIFHHVDTGSGGVYACEQSANRHANVSIDLIPYLKEGMNELIIEVVVAGSGEGWAKIRTKQHCCTEWEENWEETCG